MVMTGHQSVTRVRGQMLAGDCFLCVKLTAPEGADLVSEMSSSEASPFVCELQRLGFSSRSVT